MRILHLGQDLRFADDLRFQRGGDCEGIAQGFRPAQMVQLGRHLRDRQGRRFGDQRRKLRRLRAGVLDGGPDLAAVAGGQHSGLFQADLAATRHHAQLIGLAALEPVAQQVGSDLVTRPHDKEYLRPYPKRVTCRVRAHPPDCPARSRSVHRS